ncbi:hypothetical protein Pcinc_027733 [Petrolisthes cinctipes]|uniref:Uncharacterized protein n=1 Tax=Petrolisthes cinctipes TaxID=88211 RepID=A0AAE1F4F1_PETCI|nr:hypothetical protein Pcinc_027733 [Petrolisthes cinctipes]
MQGRTGQGREVSVEGKAEMDRVNEDRTRGIGAQGEGKARTTQGEGQQEEKAGQEGEGSWFSNVTSLNTEVTPLNNDVTESQGRLRCDLSRHHKGYPHL